MNIKQIIINLIFTILGLAFTIGIVCLSIYTSHWYILVNQQPYPQLLGSSWKNIAAATASTLTISVVAFVFAFSFPWPTYFISFAVIMQIPSIILVAIIISLTTKKDEMTEKIIENYYTNYHTQNYIDFWKCEGVSKYDDCENSTTYPCCDSMIESVVIAVTSTPYTWFLLYYLVWVISLVLLIIMFFSFCSWRKKKNE